MTRNSDLNEHKKDVQISLKAVQERAKDETDPAVLAELQAAITTLKKNIQHVENTIKKEK